MLACAAEQPVDDDGPLPPPLDVSIRRRSHKVSRPGARSTDETRRAHSSPRRIPVAIAVQTSEPPSGSRHDSVMIRAASALSAAGGWASA
jgi:hypothetical protein